MYLQCTLLYMYSINGMISVFIHLSICVCIVNRVQPPASAPVDEFGYGMGEDLYESVGVDDMEGGGMGQPPLPSMNSPHRPPPSQAPPGIPGS